MRPGPLPHTRLAALIAALALPLAAIACGADGEAGNGDAAVTVVATTTQVADLARNVGGNRAEVVGLLTANADPHDHEPRPSDVEAVAESDLLLRSGGDIDLWFESIVESSGTDAPVVELISAVETIAGDHDAHEGDPAANGDADPHWWQDPANAVLAVEAIRDRLIAIDPAGRDEYEASARRYTSQLEDLDQAIDRCIGSIPARDRKLVTSHDSFDYFAARYAIEIVGAAIPALTTQAQPSAGETAELVDLIRDEGVRAVFPEAGLDERLHEALARETGAEVGGVLWADALGPEGSGAETYLDAMATNAQTLASGLTGGERTCPGLPGHDPDRG